jgi:hypothetical protein
LVELVGVMAVSTLMIGVAITFLSQLYLVDRQIKNDGKFGQTIDRLANQLRSDIHRAVEIVPEETATAADGEPSWTMKLLTPMNLEGGVDVEHPTARTVTYELRERWIIRDVYRATTLESQELYPIPTGARVEWNVTEVDGLDWAEFTISFHGSDKLQNTAHRELVMRSRLGADLRHMNQNEIHRIVTEHEAVTEVAP